MNRKMTSVMGWMMATAMAGAAMAGTASTSANANNGYGLPGTAGATANYTGDRGFARTNSTTGDVNLARGLAVGVDRDGLDVSFSHAIAPRLGPAYAGTFNMSIGRDGEVNSSYGGALATGGLARSVEAGGTTRSDRRGGDATAYATGDTVGGGRVVARTHANSSPRVMATATRSRYLSRYGR